MAVTIDSVIIQDDEPIVAMVDGEAVMLSARAQAYFGLGEVGTEIWTLCRSERSVGEICTAIVAAFEIDHATCMRDVVRFVDELLALRLVRLVDRGGAS